MAASTIPRLWHVSEQRYPVGHVVGPRDRGDTIASLGERGVAVEDAVEAARPAGAPSRRTCVFTTPHPPLVRTFLRNRVLANLYIAAIEDEVPRTGPLDMRYMDWMLSNGATGDHPRRYWSGEPNPLRLIPGWEYLSTELVIVAVVPQFQVQQIRAVPSWLDPELSLFDP